MASPNEVQVSRPPGYDGPLYLYQASEKLAQRAIDSARPRGFRAILGKSVAALGGTNPLFTACLLAVVVTSGLLWMLLDPDSWPVGHAILRLIFFGSVLICALVALRAWLMWSLLDKHPAIPSTPVFQLAVRPDGPPASSSPRDVLESVRHSLTSRIGLWLAGLAYRAEREHRERVLIAENNQFDCTAKQELLDALGLPAEQTDAFFELLLRELREAARDELVGGAWGRLTDQAENRLVVAVKPRTEHPASPEHH